MLFIGITKVTLRITLGRLVDADNRIIVNAALSACLLAGCELIGIAKATVDELIVEGLRALSRD